MCYYSIVKEKNMCQLLEFRPFYDNYQASDVPGMFSLPHLILAVIVIATLILALYLSRNFNQKQMKILQIIVTAVVTILEIIKITIRVCKGDNYDGFIPLYFCSLYIISRFSHIFLSWYNVVCVPNYANFWISSLQGRKMV